MSALRTNVWFAGKLISENGNAVFQDRAGTNRASGARFHPYGYEISATSNDRVKFATYTRDSYTGLDYADQRFYASSYGRFHTPDPSRKSMHAKVPLSWNRYRYVVGDPINRFDRHGTDACAEDDSGSGCCDEDDDCRDGDGCCDDDGGAVVTIAEAAGTRRTRHRSLAPSTGAKPCQVNRSLESLQMVGRRQYLAILLILCSEPLVGPDLTHSALLRRSQI